MSAEGERETDDIWRRRLGTLAFVDDVVANIWKQLAELDEAENTFFLCTCSRPRWLRAPCAPLSACHALC